VLAAPSHAQLPAASRQLDTPTAQALSAAIEALNREQHDKARGLVTALPPATLTPFARSRVEQILFSVAYQQKRYDEAREHLQRAIAAGGLSEQEVADARYQCAQVLMQQERWPEGAAALESWLVTAKQPTAAAYYLLAVAYYQSKDFAKALPMSRAAIDHMQQPQESWLTLLSALYLQQKRFEDAASVLNQLITLAPGKKTYWLELSSVYGKLEDHGNALAIMQLAYDGGMLTESAEILRLADLLMFNNVPQRAATVLEEALAANRIPADEETYTKLANSWIEAGELENAAASLERAGGQAATGAALVRLGEARLDRGDWANAEATLMQAIAKGGLSDLGYAQYLIGVALYYEGRLAESRGWFEQSRGAPLYRESSETYLRFIAAEGQPRRSL
jgi:predicted Zn-dependent protease